MKVQIAEEWMNDPKFLHAKQQIIKNNKRICDKTKK